MAEPLFLTLAEVIAIHSNQVKLYGGEPGVRDIALLESAISQAQVSFGGKWLHADVWEMAAAYAFHICQNHPFFDGNKRAALASALVFLQFQDIEILDPDSMLIDVMYGVAKGKVGKQELAGRLKALSTN